MPEGSTGMKMITFRCTVDTSGLGAQALVLGPRAVGTYCEIGRG